MQMTDHAGIILMVSDFDITGFNQQPAVQTGANFFRFEYFAYQIIRRLHLIR